MGVRNPYFRISRHLFGRTLYLCMATYHSESHAHAGDAHDEPVGLADPTDTKSHCGVGAVVDLDGCASHDVVADGLQPPRKPEPPGTTGP